MAAKTVSSVANHGVWVLNMRWIALSERKPVEDMPVIVAIRNRVAVPGIDQIWITRTGRYDEASDTWFDELNEVLYRVEYWCFLKYPPQ